MLCGSLNFTNAQEKEGPAPGTILAEIEWLSVLENQKICNLEKPFVSEIEILKVLQLGSGLVNVPLEGDTIRVELRKLDDALPSINEEETYVLIENPCMVANESYYTVYFKKE